MVHKTTVPLLYSDTRVSETCSYSWWIWYSRLIFEFVIIIMMFVILYFEWKVLEGTRQNKYLFIFKKSGGGQMTSMPIASQHKVLGIVLNTEKDRKGPKIHWKDLSHNDKNTWIHLNEFKSELRYNGTMVRLSSRDTDEAKRSHAIICIGVLKTLVLHWTLVGKAALPMLACHIGTTLDQRWHDNVVNIGMPIQILWWPNSSYWKAREPNRHLSMVVQGDKN